MVAAGEASGTLEAVLERLSDFSEAQAKLRSKVSAALAYPILMLIIGCGLITLMMVAVVPKVTAIFESLDRALPWYTSLLIFVASIVSSNQMVGFVTTVAAITAVRRAMAVNAENKEARKTGRIPKSDTGAVSLGVVASLGLFVCFFLVESPLAMLMGCGLGVVAGLAAARFQGFLATPAGIVWRDTVALKLPLFGTVVRMVAVARFSRTLSTLLSSGVPLLKAMDIVKNVLGNAKLSKVIETAIGSIREGESIAMPLKRSGDFPPIVIHMIAVGEKSGQLEQMLENVARAYDTQVETRVQAMTSLMEPLIIVVMGAGVGFIAFSILMPLIQMNDFVQ
jgi:general secretion pathway protein F